ncbi:MAG: hypothetical protein SFU86_19215 [Pirellulaceae bacterium]|nr:hypothetical protein [Pirellulaceae bacterium]
MTTDSRMLSKPRRWWPRVTLRVLLALITLLAIGLGWWTHRTREQRRVVELILAAGGDVTYALRDNEVVEDPFGSTPPQRSWLERALGWLAATLGQDYFRDVSQVLLADSAAIDDLDCLPGLEFIGIAQNAQLQQRDFQTIANLPALKRLLLFRNWDKGQPQNDAHSRVLDDAAVEWLARNPHLEVVIISGSRVTRAGLRKLAAAPAMRYIELSSYEIGDPKACFSDMIPGPSLSHVRVSRLGADGKSLDSNRWSPRPAPPVGASP